MELEERTNQAPQAVFGDPKVSPTIAKAVLSSEAHKADVMEGLKTVLVAQQTSASTASSLLLISEFTFFLMMLYLLNHKDVNVKRLSWSSLHTSVAIFVSMLLFMSTKSLRILLAGHTLDRTAAGVALSWTRYVIVWILGPVILLRRGVDDESREAWCSVVKWFTAFCAADAFGELMMIGVFTASVGAQFGGFVLCCFIIWLQCFGACWARHFVVLAASSEAADGVSPREMKEKWAESWQVAETTYAGYVLGLMLSMWTRFATSGIPTGPYGRPAGQNGAKSGWLQLWTGVSVLIGFIVIGLVYRLGAPERSWSARRFSQMTTSIMAMFCAWMSLYSLEWEFLYYTSTSSFGGQAADINSCILLAICASVFMFAIMRIIDSIADRTGSPAVRSTAIFCELFIGLTWQRVFYTAIMQSRALLGLTTFCHSSYKRRRRRKSRRGSKAKRELKHPQRLRRMIQASPASVHKSRLHLQPRNPKMTMKSSELHMTSFNIFECVLQSDCACNCPELLSLQGGKDL